MRTFVIAAVALLLAGCSATPQTARQGIYVAVGTYDTALKTSTSYARLPRCGKPTSPLICSDQALVTRASNAANTALPAVNAAIDAAANTNASDSTLSQAQTTAVYAVGAFTAIVTKMEIK